MIVKVVSFVCLLISCSISSMEVNMDEQLHNASIGEKSFIKGMVVVSLVNLSAKENCVDGTKVSSSGDETKVSYKEVDDDIHSAIIFEGFNPLKLGIIPETYITASGFKNRLKSFVDTIPFTSDKNNVWSLGVSFGPDVARDVDHSSGYHPAKLVFWNREQCLKRITEGVQNTEVN